MEPYLSYSYQDYLTQLSFDSYQITKEDYLEIAELTKDDSTIPELKNIDSQKELNKDDLNIVQKSKVKNNKRKIFDINNDSINTTNKRLKQSKTKSIQKKTIYKIDANCLPDCPTNKPYELISLYETIICSVANNFTEYVKMFGKLNFRKYYMQFFIPNVNLIFKKYHISFYDMIVIIKNIAYLISYNLTEKDYNDIYIKNNDELNDNDVFNNSDKFNTEYSIKYNKDYTNYLNNFNKNKNSFFDHFIKYSRKLGYI